MFKYRLKKLPRKKTIVWTTIILLFVISMGSIVRYYAYEYVSHSSKFDNEQVSSITNNIVYVNDLNSDWDYYMGLNFTNVTSDNLPTENIIYSDSNLVAVKATYSAYDYNYDLTNLSGEVSPLEDEYQYVYYKYYPKDSQGYITIELPDNLFSARPRNNGVLQGFNGWATDNEDVTLLYEKDVYTRYAKVKVDGKTASLDFYAVWIDANEKTGYNNRNNLDDGGMKQLPKSEVMGNVYDHSDYEFHFRTDLEYYISNTANNGTRYTGYVQSGTTYVYYTNQQCNTGGGCAYYSRLTDTSIMSTDTRNVYIFTDNGNNTFTRVAVAKDITNPDGYFDSVEEHRVYESTRIAYKLNFPNNYQGVTLFYKKDRNGEATNLYYDANGIRCDMSGNSCSSGTYKLIQNTDSYKDIVTDVELPAQIETDEVSGYASQFTNPDNYYYLVTRDMNILVINSNTDLSDYVSLNKPYTLTGSADGRTIPNNYITVDYLTPSGNSGTYYMGLANDMTIENIKTNTGDNAVVDETIYGRDATRKRRVLSANRKNLKIGRNVTSSTSGRFTFYGIMGTNTSSTTHSRFKVIVESGVYDYFLSNGFRSNGNYNYINLENTFTGYFVYGSDYDRANNNDNKKLIVTFCAFTSYLGGTYGYNSYTPSSNMLIKSGSYGKGTNGDAYSGDYSYGVYVGSRGYSQDSNRTTKLDKSLRTLIVEGGDINVINGGPLVDSSYYTKNVVSLYMKGGTVRDIFGGAGQAETGGNRIISVTGGTVTNNVFGGSNSYQGSSDDGYTNGDSLVYIGGNVTIGSSGATALFGAQAGNVYGAGNGRSGNQYTNLGVVNNSHVIINGGTISGSVFGGGNYGTTGFKTTSNTTTIVDLYSGKVNGSVFGAGNDAGAGYNNTTTLRHTITINLGKSNGTGNIDVLGSIYGGSNNSGVTRGNVLINMYSGTVNTVSGTNVSGVYGGGYGSNTYVCGNVTMISNTNNTSSTDNNARLKIGEVYGGSALGTVNRCTSSGTKKGDTTITINGGTITTLFGGGKGSTTVSPVTAGNITVTIDDGLITNAFNGNNLNGTPSGTTTITLNGGRVVEALYGGNNAGGYVNGSHVNIVGGVAGNAFGGGYQAETRGTTNVNVTGGIIGTYNDAGTVVYGSVYGGGNEATAVNTIVTMNGGATGNVFGGGNEGQVTGTTTVNVQNGSINNTSGGVFGGGNKAAIGTSTVTISGGTFAGVCTDEDGGASVFGGGNDVQNGNNELQAATSSTVYINAGSIVNNVFGGSNKNGIVTTTNVYGQSGTVRCNVYGGGLEAETTTSNVTLTGTTFSAIETEDIANAISGNAFGGGKSADVGTSHVTLNGATLNNVFGGSNQAGYVSNSYITINSGKSTNIFGGNNAGGSTKNTHVTLNGTANITDVFGGSNGRGAYIGGEGRDSLLGSPHTEALGTTHVELVNGTISGSVYGGGNLAVTYGSTQIDVYNGTISGSIYGGGNNAHVGDFSTPYKIDNTKPYTGDYDGNKDYNKNNVTTTVNVARANTGSIFGSGNAAFVHGTTNVNVGETAYNALTGTKSRGDIVISGTIYGGSYTNTDNTNQTNFDTVGVVGSTNVNLDSTNYYNGSTSRIHIDGSIYGQGNNSNIQAFNDIPANYLSTVNVTNYGLSDSEPVVFASIQRAERVNVLDSHIELTGAPNKQYIDDSTEYSFVAVDQLYLLGTRNNSNPGGTTIYAAGGGTDLKSIYSGYMDGNTFMRETYKPDESTKLNGVDNKIYMLPTKVFVVYSGRVNQDGIPGVVHGMTFLGMYKKTENGYERGIYDSSYTNSTSSNTVSESVFNEFGDPSKKYFTYVRASSFDDTNMKLNKITEQVTDDEGKTTEVWYTIDDGYYTNYAKSSNSNYEVSTYYVGVTPTTNETPYYKWIVGANVLQMTVNLKASKYSTQASVSEAIEFTELTVNGSNADVRFKLNSVDTSNFGVNATHVKAPYSSWTSTLIANKVDIPQIAETEACGNEYCITNANKVFALSMGTDSSGWQYNYMTNIYSDSEYAGDEEFLYDSTKGERKLSFWLYHSKNIDLTMLDDTDGNKEIGLGFVNVSMTATNPNAGDSDGENDISVTINISLMADNDRDAYGFARAPGKKYSVFSSANTVIDTNSSYSIYQSMALDTTGTVNAVDGLDWSPELLYNSANSRYLVSADKLPANTRITMMDLADGSQYYYIVTGNESGSNEYHYDLSQFISMSNVTTSSSSNLLLYNPDMSGANSKYCHAEGDKPCALAVEEFIFNVDFSNVTSTDMNNFMGGDSKTSKIYMRLGVVNPSTGVSFDISPAVANDGQLEYTVVSSGVQNLTTTGGFINTDGSINDPDSEFNVYKQTPAKVKLSTEFSSDEGVMNTLYEDYQLGARIRFVRVENDGVNVNESDVDIENLRGLVATINGVDYEPQNDNGYGSIRLKLAGRISAELNTNVTLSFQRVSEYLTAGSYKLCVSTFASYDGIYDDGNASEDVCFAFRLVNFDFGLKVETEPVQITHDVYTGLDADSNDTISYSLEEINYLPRPVLKVSMQRLDTHSDQNHYDDIRYTNMNLCDFVSQITITGPGITGERTINCADTNVDTNDSGTLDSIYYDLGLIHSYYGASVGPSNPIEPKDYVIAMKMKEGVSQTCGNEELSCWQSGTYKVVFSIFAREGDNGSTTDTFIGSDYEYLIIRKLDVNEYIAEGSGG